MNRPPDAPEHIPQWAWELLAWHNGGERGPRPKDAPRAVPAWFWHWYAWRNWANQHQPIPKPPVASAITMYDSTDLSQIPENAAAVAGYVGGHWPTFHTLAHGWPHAHLLSIAVASVFDAECLDIENGDATPDLAPGWVKRQLDHGVKRPVVYSSVSEMQQVIDTLAHAGISRPHYRVWTAHYNGKEHRCTIACGNNFHDMADATQWWDHAHNLNLDISSCAPGFFS